MRKYISFLLPLLTLAIIFGCRDENLNPLRQAELADQGPNFNLGIDPASNSLNFQQLSTSQVNLLISSQHPELISKVEILLLARLDTMETFVSHTGKPDSTVKMRITFPASPTPWAAGTEALGVVFKSYTGDQIANTTLSFTGADVAQTVGIPSLTTNNTVIVNTRITLKSGRVFVPTDNVGGASTAFNPPVLVMQQVVPVVCPIPFPAGTYSYTASGVSSGGWCGGNGPGTPTVTGTVTVTLTSASIASFSAEPLSKLQNYWYVPCQFPASKLTGLTATITNACTSLKAAVNSGFGKGDTFTGSSSTGDVSYNTTTKTISLRVCEAGDCANDVATITLVKQ